MLCSLQCLIQNDYNRTSRALVLALLWMSFSKNMFQQLQDRGPSNDAYLS
jgi:hypothetical protein